MQQALIGTAKGLIVLEIIEGKTPEISKIHFAGFAVTMVYADPRNDRWWAGISHKHWGQKLHYSDDAGATWEETGLPNYQQASWPDGTPAKLRQIWCMSHGGPDHPDRLWLGTEPAALFVSEDNGLSFDLCTALWNHPSRNESGKWFGAGSDRPFLHTIAVDPRNGDHIYVAVSSAGVFESLDGGQSWEARNRGLVATYLPNPAAEVGHDPHQLFVHPTRPDVLWQQNHCGIFVSKDGGEYWADVSAKEGIPYYGFALAIDHDDPAKAWVIPVESDEQRIAPGLRLQVFKTEDFGESWQTDSDGLPAESSFDIVLRHAFAKDGETFIFGTTNGNLYFRANPNNQWRLLHHSLTKVNSVYLFRQS